MSKNYASYSQINTHRACPQKWQYGALRGLEQDREQVVKVELEFGNWWHALRAADSIERGRKLGTIQHVPDEIRTVDGGPKISTAARDTETLVESVLGAAERWWDSLPSEAHDEWDKRIGGSLPDRLTYVDEQWHERWDAERQNEQPLAVELKWTRELPWLTDSDTGVVADPDTKMVGFVDEVFYDAQRKIVVVRDHKAHKSLGTQSSADDMMDSQLQVYAWGASTMITEWGFGSVKAVAYDRVRMTAPKSPKVTKSGTLSKAVSDYDLRTYLAFCAGPDGEGEPFPGLKKDGSGAGFYTAEDHVIENLSDPASSTAWFQNTLTPLNRNVVTGHLRASVDTAFEMERTRRRVAESGEAGRNLTSMCKWCPFVELCRAELSGGVGGDYDLAAFGLKYKSKK